MASLQSCFPSAVFHFQQMLSKRASDCETSPSPLKKYFICLFILVGWAVTCFHQDISLVHLLILPKTLFAPSALFLCDFFPLDKFLHIWLELIENSIVNCFWKGSQKLSLKLLLFNPLKNYSYRNLGLITV